MFFLKKITHFIGIGLICVSIGVVSVHAEIYKYIDENGIVRYTDDINMVPADQRQNVEEYNEITEPQAPAQDIIEYKEGEARIEEIPENKSGVTGNAYANEMNELEERRKVVKEEYEALIKEREKLDAMRENVKTKQEIQEYNKLVDEYSNKSKEFVKRRDALSEDIKAYNQRLKERIQAVESGVSE